jgi:phage gp36-like protein
LAYITQTDLLQRMTLADLTQLTDDAHSGSPDEDVVAGVCDEASSKVDGYCRKKYATPLQQSSEVAAIARDIAVYLLFSRRPQQIRESVRQRYEDAIKLLNDISSGKAVLDQPAGAAPQTITAGPKSLPQDLRFKESNLEGFI